MKTILVSCETLADHFKSSLDFYTKTTSIGSSISYKNSILLVQDLFEEQLFQRLFWSKNYKEKDELLTHYLPWFDFKLIYLSNNEDLSEKLDYFYTEVFLNLIYQINLTLDIYVGDRNSDSMWLIWYLTRYKESILLKPDKDFRIKQWEKLVKKGVINDLRI